jgi:hypothetical protein
MLFFCVVFFLKEPHFSADNILTINTMAGILGVSVSVSQNILELLYVMALGNAEA